MSNEETAPKSESQDKKQESTEKGSGTEKEQVVINPLEPEQLEPEEEEMEAPSEPSVSSTEPLRDPRTGELIRDQNPGVPKSAWVGNHHINDVEVGVAKIKEPAIPQSDFGAD